MTGYYELTKKLAIGKGATVGNQFARYLQGLITKQEFDEFATKVEGQYEEIAQDLKKVSEATIQAVMLYLDS